MRLSKTNRGETSVGLHINAVHARNLHPCALQRQFSNDQELTPPDTELESQLYLRCITLIFESLQSGSFRVEQQFAISQLYVIAQQLQ